MKFYAFSVLILIAVCSAPALTAQTITYDNFMNVVATGTSVKVAQDASFDAGLKTITGTGVTWDASDLEEQPGFPIVNLTFNDPALTPNGDLYPNSNYAVYDEGLLAVLSISYDYYCPDSLVNYGDYNPDGKHEIYQNPDKKLIFPFSFGESFTDNYEKTNYSDAVTISSYQTGERTVTFDGFGTLILPQGSFNNVARVFELRTNSLGPDSYYYTWFDINTGDRLMYRSENAGSITTVFIAGEPTTSINESANAVSVSIHPNPIYSTATITIEGMQVNEDTQVRIYSIPGNLVETISANTNSIALNRDKLPDGMYFYSVMQNDIVIYTGKIMLTSK